MKLAENRQLWTQRVSAYRSSGMKAKEWCEKENLKKSALSYWITKLNNEDRAKKNPSFVKVIAGTEPETSTSSCLKWRCKYFCVFSLSGK